MLHAADVLGSDLVQIECITIKYSKPTPLLSRRDSGVGFDDKISPMQSCSDIAAPNTEAGGHEQDDAFDAEITSDVSTDSSPDSLLSTPDHAIPTGDYMCITDDSKEGKTATCSIADTNLGCVLNNRN